MGGQGMTKAGGKHHNDGPEQLRPARMRIETTVLMSRGSQSQPTELVDISATGALLRRPLGWPGEGGQSWVLDMIFALPSQRAAQQRAGMAGRSRAELDAGHDFRPRPAHPPGGPGEAHLGPAHRFRVHAHTGGQAGSAMESAGRLRRHPGDVARRLIRRGSRWWNPARIGAGEAAWSLSELPGEDRLLA